jgi:hypothetical protein
MFHAGYFQPVSILEERLKITGSPVTNPDNGQSYPRVNVRRAVQSDSDLDGYPNTFDTCLTNPADNCLSYYNPGQEDGDHDARGDVCDNCPQSYNPTQADSDFDVRGDPCDNCPSGYNPGQEDGDTDTLGDVCDDCPVTYNPTQENTDGDARGDVCDCAPTDGSAFAVPSVVDGVQITDIPGGYRITWTSQAQNAGSGTVYDNFSGRASQLQPAGDFSTGSCLAENVNVSQWDYTGQGSPPGDALYFMLRGQNACPGGTGTYGNSNRDAKAAVSASPCN